MPFENLREAFAHRVKVRVPNAESHPVSEDSPIEPTDQPEAVRLEVVDGTVRVVAEPGAAGTAELTWPAGAVRVTLFGERVEGSTCRVPADASLRVEAIDQSPRNEYQVKVSRDRMEATLRVVRHPGCTRALVAAKPTDSLALRVEEDRVQPDEPTLSGANAALQDAEVSYGIDADAVREAVASPGEEFVVATGLDPIEGRDGYLEDLVDFRALRMVGVLAETPLLRRVRKREGVPGRDVTDRELAVPTVKDARIRPGVGVSVDEQGIMAIATVDGAPRRDSDGNVEVRHELVVEVVDTVSGDIEFNGSVRVEGDVGEARTVIARDEIIVEGNVDRARLESGGSMQIMGSIMSSVLRAGGERAVAATIADRVLELPRALGVVAAQARQLRDAQDKKVQVEQQRAQKTGEQAVSAPLSHGLSIQVVLERIHRSVLSNLASVVEDLREAGPTHAAAADRAARWHRMLATAANNNLTPDQFQEVLVEVGALATDVRKACDQPADLVVSYMQACEAEATGAVTLTGKGIFNSRIVAWGGMEAQHYEAVFRGGSIVSHGRVHVREVGSPAGAKTLVQLGASASLESDRAYAGTVVTGPGYTHRFVADRSHVKVDFDTGGSMNVESLAA